MFRPGAWSQAHDRCAYQQARSLTSSECWCGFDSREAACGAVQQAGGSAAGRDGVLDTCCVLGTRSERCGGRTKHSLGHVPGLLGDTGAHRSPAGQKSQGRCYRHFSLFALFRCDGQQAVPPLDLMSFTPVTTVSPPPFLFLSLPWKIDTYFNSGFVTCLLSAWQRAREQENAQ